MWQILWNRWCSTWKFSPPRNQQRTRLPRAKSTVVWTWWTAHSVSIRASPSPAVTTGTGKSASPTQWASWNTTLSTTPLTNAAIA